MKNKSFWVLLLVLISIFFGMIYYNNHQDAFYVKRAHICFKKNNISCTQYNLEKAFQLGVTSLPERELYLNSIITAPLDIKAQERLYRFMNLPVDDSVKVRAEFFVYDLRRAINNKYVDNYIMQSVLNKNIVRWAQPIITYHILMPEEELPEYYKKEIENAFIDWGKAMDFQLSFEESEKDANIIIKFDYHNPAETDDLKYIVAYTFPNIVNKVLKDMTILFYVKDPLGNFYTQNQVYNTALHEIAHALGVMGHSSNKKNVMYLTKDETGVFNDARSELSEADISTMKLLYKLKPDITNKEDKKSEYLPFLVLGDSEDVINAKIREAKLYIKRAPHLPNGYMDLAEAYVGVNDYSKAIKILDKALRIADTDKVKEMIYFNLAVCHYYSENYILAEDYIERAIEINSSENSLYVLAKIYLKTNHIDKSRDIFEGLIRNNPSSIDYTVNLANIYLQNKQYLKVRKVLKNFIENNPNERFNPILDSYGFLKWRL